MDERWKDCRTNVCAKCLKNITGSRKQSKSARAGEMRKPGGDHGMKNFLAGILFTVIVLMVGGYCYLKKGYVDFNADQQPYFLDKQLGMAAVDASTDRRGA